MYSSGKLKNIILVEIFEIVAKPQKLKKEVDFFFWFALYLYNNRNDWICVQDVERKPKMKVY